MSFIDHVDAVLEQGRELARSLMVDTCRITRALKPGEPGYVEPVMDPVTMQYPTVARKTIYEGPCRMQVASTAVGIGFNDYDAGDREVTAQQPEVQLPLEGTEDVRVDDEILWLTSANDAALVGHVFTVLAPHRKTHATMRHIRVWEGVG